MLTAAGRQCWVSYDWSTGASSYNHWQRPPRPPVAFAKAPAKKRERARKRVSRVKATAAAA
eukprot:CAMPEP_0168482074 /NCGR_PEP_ID=MMETSP0228-20121227/64845_1 /TAXON_ID=133427 /ORGANISM="Protoceratium reticulatum, Strain CCCM 535 (=CCMP 1889)" /LENGTH=60 /DNA_ID=CAMNT_0008498473 /DNA_START=19 /DNA_END=197 /DNA_ORIENTATION=-